MTTACSSKRTRTTSSLSTFVSCRRKYELRYVRRLRPRTPPAWSAFGRAFHKFDETLHSGQTLEEALAAARTLFWADREDTLELSLAWEGFVDVAAGYAATHHVLAEPDPERGLAFRELDSGLKFFPDLAEVPFRVPVFTPQGRRSGQAEYAGVFDAIVEDAAGDLWLYETKTVALLSEAYFDKLSFDRQVLRYVYAARQIFGPKLKGVIYNAVAKTAPRYPDLRQDGSVSTAAVSTTPELFLEQLARVRETLRMKMGLPNADAREAAMCGDIPLAASFLAHSLDEGVPWDVLVARAEQDKDATSLRKKIAKARQDQAKYHDLLASTRGRLFRARRTRVIGDEELEEVQWELYQLDRDIHLAEQDGRFYPNDRACDQMGGCEYRALCLKGQDSDYEAVEASHVELPEGGFLTPSRARPIRSELALALQCLQETDTGEAE